MNICIYIGPQGVEWSRHYLPEKSPAELPVAGREWCLHAIDLCAQLPQVTGVFFAECFGSQRLLTHISRSDYWGLPLHYLPTRPCDSPVQLLDQHPQIPRDDNLLIFWGQVLPDVSSVSQILQSLGAPLDATAPAPQPNGLLLLREGRLHPCECPLHRIDTLQRYFDLNFKFLANSGIYTLPGYSKQQGFGIGKNVIILPNCRLDPPLNIQNDSYLGRSLEFSDGVIVGKDVLIDDRTALRHSIILDATYIGKNLYFQDKLVSGNRVIDVPSGCFVDLEEEFLAMGATPQKFDRFQIVGMLVALLLAVLLAPAYLLSCLLPRRLREIPLPAFLKQVYPKCWGVACGRSNLVRYGLNDQHYAFRYSDMWLMQQNEEHRKMSDQFYYHHRTLKMMLGVPVISLLKRLVVLSPVAAEDDAPPEMKP